VKVSTSLCHIGTVITIFISTGASFIRLASLRSWWPAVCRRRGDG
jgi:hypothetical protein